jgi:hypothetical protein
MLAAVSFVLREELERIRQRHGHAVLLDAHSIRSRLPLLFDGTLPDLNLGSNGGQSAAGTLIASASKALRSSRFSMVLDGRFKGGYITRHMAALATVFMRCNWKWRKAPTCRKIPRAGKMSGPVPCKPCCRDWWKF